MAAELVELETGICRATQMLYQLSYDDWHALPTLEPYQCLDVWGLKMTWPPCWLLRGQHVVHPRGYHCTQVIAPQKGLMLSNFFKKKRTLIHYNRDFHELHENAWNQKLWQPMVLSLYCYWTLVFTQYRQKCQYDMSVLFVKNNWINAWIN